MHISPIITILVANEQNKGAMQAAYKAKINTWNVWEVNCEVKSVKH